MLVIPLPVVSRLVGCKSPSMTKRYAHVGDRETEGTAERTGVAIAQALGTATSRSLDESVPAVSPPAVVR